MMYIVLALGFLLARTLAAQEAAPPGPDPKQVALDHAIATGSRFRELKDPVVATHAIAELGALVCAERRDAGVELFHDAIVRLQNLKLADFTTPRYRLPLPSFTALWNFVTPAALKCSPDLQRYIDSVQATAKMREERQRAQEKLRTAASLYSTQPGRAAQLLEAAMSATEPTLLDIPALTLFLSHLRGRAPEVSDELFPAVLHFLTEGEAPSPALLLELGKYLFVARSLWDRDDKDQESETAQARNLTLGKFERDRKSSNSEDIHDYIEAAITVIRAGNSVNYNAVAAYALGFQMLQRAETFDPELGKQLRDVLMLAEAAAGSGAQEVRSAVMSAGGLDAEGGEGPRNRDRLIEVVLSAARRGRFGEARDTLQSVDDLSTRSQVRILIDFAEAAAAVEKRDLQWAFTLSRSLPPGIKRCMVYAGIAAHSRDRSEALDYYQLALRDVEVLPAEQRMVMLAGLAGVMLRLDTDSGYLSMDLLVKAANDAYTSPYRGYFDPAVARRRYSGGRATTATDSSLILANARHLSEVVDSGLSRHSFSLNMPGVPTWQVAAAVRGSRGADAARLEAILVALFHETLLSSTLNSLTAQQLEFKKAPPPSER